MPSEIIQWYPGHMAKTGRMMREMLPEVDLVIELRDARIPFSSANPELKKITGNKPTLTLFSKTDLADPNVTAMWKKKLTDDRESFLFVNSSDKRTVSQLKEAVNALMSEKLGRYKEKGMTGRSLRAMIVGIPNIGKSTLINNLAGGRRAKVEDRPGVTRDKQWVSTAAGLDLLDTPGVLWPKFEDQTVGENLALTGAIRDEILDTQRIAYILCSRLKNLYPNLVEQRYKVSVTSETEDGDMFEMIARKRGFIVSGGEINEERTAVTLLDEFRGGKIGRITLEKPC
ncbi:MAG: ribosome biogenesis GTPase YlqF [Firmicutes bacterium]|nr:ribosome biogenesis GTPase YlqF [Candidatus Colimorpha enterica]